MAGRLLKGHTCETPKRLDERPSIDWVYACDCGTAFKVTGFSSGDGRHWDVSWRQMVTVNQYGGRA